MLDLELTLWALALLLTLPKPQLHIFQDSLKGNGTLQTERENFTRINLSTTSHSLMQVLENSFSRDIIKKPTPASKRAVPPVQYSDNTRKTEIVRRLIYFITCIKEVSGPSSSFAMQSARERVRVYISWLRSYYEVENCTSFIQRSRP